MKCEPKKINSRGDIVVLSTMCPVCYGEGNTIHRDPKELNIMYTLHCGYCCERGIPPIPAGELGLEL